MIATVTYINKKALLLVAGSSFENTAIVNGYKNIKFPELYIIDWLESEKLWEESKSLKLLNRNITRLENSITFIDEHSLSKSNDIEALLLSSIFQLQQYFSGKLKQFNLPLNMSMGTTFQRSVWQALLQIPYAQTISYAQLAQNIGNPSAYRAVANANGKNPLSIIIPCHRVIASNGELGGYTGGIDKKSMLLAIEQNN